jgi:DNA invertase Pin-like site-specific DNA recombinase
MKTGKTKIIKRKGKEMKRRKRKWKIYEIYEKKIESEISRNGYICGTLKELAELLRIPLSSFRRSINSQKFKKEKLKQNRQTYYFISFAKLNRGKKNL